MNNCPFCGSFNTKVSAESTEVNGEPFHIVFVECLEDGCKARGPGIGGFGKFVKDEEPGEALKKWNKRF